MITIHNRHYREYVALKIVPLELKEANALVEKWHRHHFPVVGHRFSVGVMDMKTGELVGAAIAGRPVARYTNHKTTIEVSRLVTNGTKNACSILYAACARIAREMGYEKIQTFILDTETGRSCEAAGWAGEALTFGGDGWQSRDGRRTDQPTNPKRKFVRKLV